MTSCVSAAQPSGGFGSAIEKAIEEATCQCRFEKMPKSMVTKEQFFDAAKLCRAELGRNPKEFTEQYYPRVARANKSEATALPSRQRATFKYGTGSIYLGPDCVAVSSHFGRGRWAWANAGIFVDLEKKKDIRFAKAESPYEDQRCAL